MEFIAPKDVYSENVKIYSNKAQFVKRRLVLISIFRFFTFIGFVASVVFLIKGFSFYILSGSVLLFASFIFLIIKYISETKQLNHVRLLQKINQDEIKALDFNYSVFDSGEKYINREHAFAYDLDLFGEGSVYQYLNRTTTLVGRELLAQNLLYPVLDKTIIYERQDAVKELAPKLVWRQNFMATGYSSPISEDDNKNILNWISEPVFYSNRWFFKWIVVLLPAISFILLGLNIFGGVHYSWFVISSLLQLFFASINLRKTNAEQNKVSKELEILKNYYRLIQFIEKESFNASQLVKLKSNLKVNNINAGAAFKNLIKIIDAFDTRLNLVAGFALNALLMWDLLCILRLDRWKLNYGINIENWMDTIAEFDVYCSKSNFYYNNQQYVFPVISDKSVLHVKELGHPLIPANRRVNNDFQINNFKEIVIITGANMAGKSTFLRTIGVNIVLALNGMPVCANEFEFRLFHLYTGMRTADSLKENESYFYAELKRLKHIIDKLKNNELIFVLLDEILKGTNSVDKAKGSWKFVEYIKDLGATGIVATHDLNLCEIEKYYPLNFMNKCFEVEIDNDQIRFDYKLRNGITKNMNATILMKQMGIFSN